MKRVCVLLLLTCLLLVPPAAAAEDILTEPEPGAGEEVLGNSQVSVERDITGTVQSRWVEMDVQNGLTFGDFATDFQNYLNDVRIAVQTNMQDGWDLEVTVRDQSSGSGRGHMRLAAVDVNQYLIEPLYVTGPALGGGYESLESPVSIIEEYGIVGGSYVTSDVHFRQQVSPQDEAGEYRITVRFTAIVRS